MKYTRIAPGLYESSAGHVIERNRIIEQPGPARWFVTYPGQVAPDAAFATLRDAKEALDPIYVIRYSSQDDLVFTGPTAYEDMQQEIRDDVLTVRAISHLSNERHVYFVREPYPGENH